jgi:hypothetical protein
MRRLFVSYNYLLWQRHVIHAFCRRAGIPRHTNAPRRSTYSEALGWME